MASGMPGISPFATAATPLGAVGDPGGPYAPQAQGLPQRLNTAAQVAGLLAAQPPLGAAGRRRQQLADFRALQRSCAPKRWRRRCRSSSQVGFVNLKDGDVLPVAQTACR